MNFHKIKSVCYRLFAISQYLFFKIIGLSPWSIEASDIITRNRRIESHSFKCSFSYVGMGYNIIFILVTSSLNIYGFYYTASIEKVHKSFNIFQRTFAFCSSFGIIFIVLFITIRQKFFINFINHLRNIDKNLRTCTDYDIKYDCTNDSIFASNLIVTSALAILRQLFTKTKLFLFMSLPNFLTTWPLIHYTILINIIKLRLISINSMLSKLGTTKSKVSQSRELILKDLDSIKRAYAEICKGCDQIVALYGIPTLIMILIYLTKTTHSMYYIVIELISPQKIDLAVYGAGIVLLFPIYIFVLLTSSVAKVVKENKETVRIINSLRDRFDMDEEIFEKLMKFSSQLSYLTVEFTCCGILPLDRDLLMIILSTIVSYLVISVQFYIDLSAN
ncbi:GSCOCT00014050001.2-RA-CDS [Cotesia congregata]|uniref:Gustatory receptor n=1 Tax=Cotesia congregata TaxID=51543 RepID=A0A8J2HAF3_COTCN|nr:GSCOCT00014050001.2-RA-CDS [Cotesia congregata]CAG5084092.1 gustatory receptor 66 [Cotesia congregata]